MAVKVTRIIHAIPFPSCLTLCEFTDATPFTSAKSKDCVTPVTSSLSPGICLHCVFVCERHVVTVSDTHLKSHPFPPQLSKQRQLG